MGYSPQTRNRLIVWTDATIAAFEKVKEAVTFCQKLFFLDDSSPIVLSTDASDYGIGAFLAQIVNGVIYPIMFVSASLSKVQQRWSVPEKECYAIDNASQKMDHSIRDRTFTLKVDHKNLVRVYSTGSPKVLRWKLLIQEYSFKIEHIKGSDNFVPDAFSRLCAISDIIEHNWWNALDDFAITQTQLGNQCEIDWIAPISSRETRKIPLELYRQIGQVHNSVVGHHGVSITVTKLLRQEISVLKLRKYVRDFI